MKRKLLLWLLIFSVPFILLAGQAFADIIIKKDGREIRGNIVSISDEQVSMDVSGVVIYINRNDIEKIIREDKPDVLLKAEQWFNEADYKNALAQSVEVIEQEPQYAQTAKRIFFSSLQNLSSKGTDLLNRHEYEEGIKFYLFLFQHIQKETVRTYFFDDPESWSLFMNEAQRHLSHAYYEQALQLLDKQDQTLIPTIKRNLNEALNYVKPRTPRYFDIKLLLGRINFDQHEYETAREYLEEVSRLSPKEEHREQAILMLNDLLPRIQKPSPSPQPTEVVRYVPPPVAPVQPPPSQQPDYSDLPIWKRYLYQVRDHEIFQRIQSFAFRISQGEYLFVIVVPLIIILVWIISFKYLKSRARKGDILAASMLGSAKLLGPLMILIYKIKRIKIGGPKKRCPFCGKGIDDIEAYSDLNFYVCPHCQENITPVFELTDYIDHLVKNVEKSLQRSGRKGSMTGPDGLPIEKDAMLKLVRSIVTYAVRRRASDVHIEQEIERVKVRARIDGILFDIFTFPKTIANALVSAIKVMSNLDISEKRIPQDGQFSLWIDKTDIDVRVATSPAAMGEKVSMRLLDIRSVMIDSIKLGLEGGNLEKFERAIRKPHGLILVTGPSGSGKTTSLYVALNTINTGEKNIITIEDPIEYHFKGLNQIQVNPAANFTFATGLRSIIRQDPDVIMVGEIRDLETAEIAIEAALTGHLVFSTLHTIDAAGAFGRLIDLGISPKRFAPAIICVIAQRLVRINCPECKKPYKPKKTDLESLGLTPEKAKDITFMKGTGCPHCFNSGFYGRIGIFEILMPDESMRDMLENQMSTSVIRELGRKAGMRSLRDEGIVKIQQGLTTVEEVIRVTS